MYIDFYVLLLLYSTSFDFKHQFSAIPGISNKFEAHTHRHPKLIQLNGRISIVPESSFGCCFDFFRRRLFFVVFCWFQIGNCGVIHWNLHAFFGVSFFLVNWSFCVCVYLLATCQCVYPLDLWTISVPYRNEIVLWDVGKKTANEFFSTLWKSTSVTKTFIYLCFHLCDCA